MNQENRRKRMGSKTQQEVLDEVLEKFLSKHHPREMFPDGDWDFFMRRSRER